MVRENMFEYYSGKRKYVQKYENMFEHYPERQSAQMKPPTKPKTRPEAKAMPPLYDVGEPEGNTQGFLLQIHEA
jgi:hypothetical protein